MISQTIIILDNLRLSLLNLLMTSCIGFQCILVHDHP